MIGRREFWNVIFSAMLLNRVDYCSWKLVFQRLEAPPWACRSISLRLRSTAYGEWNPGIRARLTLNLIFRIFSIIFFSVNWKSLSCSGVTFGWETHLVTFPFVKDRFGSCPCCLGDDAFNILPTPTPSLSFMDFFFRDGCKESLSLIDLFRSIKACHLRLFGFRDEERTPAIEWLGKERQMRRSENGLRAHLFSTHCEKNCFWSRATGLSDLIWWLGDLNLIACLFFYTILTSCVITLFLALRYPEEIIDNN